MGPLGYSARDHRRASFSTMEPNSPADDLPALYRAILDRVAELEAAGQRRDATLVRADATRAYSRAWDGKARRELEALLRRAARPTAAERLLGHGPRRRFGRTGPRGPQPVVARER
jgi:hypothetical protein